VTDPKLNATTQGLKLHWPLQGVCATASSPMDAPRRLQALQLELRECRRALKNECRNAARRAKRLREQGACKFMRWVVMLVYWWSNKNLELAAECWARRRQHHICVNEDVSLSVGLRVVQEWVDEVDDTFWNELLNRTTDECQRARAEARKFLADAHAAVWTLAGNRNKGHAPTTRQVHAERAAIESSLQRHPTERSAVERSTTAIRKWGSRWRKSWTFKFGKLKAREHMDVDTVRLKARTNAPNILIFLLVCGSVFASKKR